MKIRSFYCSDEKLMEKIDDLRWKERKSFSEIITSALSEYFDKHGDGNPNYTLDHFDDPNFKACPAFWRPESVWKQYLHNIDDIKFKEWAQQLEILNHQERIRSKIYL